MRKMTIALLCAGALLFAACGDDSGDDVDDAEDTTEDTAEDAADEDAATDDADDEAAPAADTDFCQQFQAMQERYSDEELNQDFEEAMDQLEEALGELRAMDPPSEIADEWETYLDGLEAFTQIDLTDPEAAQAAQEDLDQAELQSAMETVDTYLRDECGIDLNA